MEYISSKINKNVISSWKLGDKILISSQTGTGKTQMVKTTLLSLCEERDWRLLLFSNRTILRSQNEEALGDNASIRFVNYQSIEDSVVNRNGSLENLIHGYKVLVFDEAHHIFMDSEFNRRTDIFLDVFSKKFPDVIMIFMTATPELVLDTGAKFDHSYSTKRDYSYVDRVLFYNKMNAPENIIQNIPPEEKVIFFSSDAQEAYNLTQKFDDAVFVCSENHSLYKYSSSKAVEQIVSKRYFEPRILCTTKVLDNGVSIEDSSVKHIIIDMLDMTSFIQCLGRRRIQNKEEKITLYVKNYHSGILQYSLMLTKKKLKRVDDLNTLGREYFQQMNFKNEIDDIIDNNFMVNEAKLHFYRYKSKWLEKTKKVTDGYKVEVMKALNLPEDRMGSADNEYEKIGIKEYLGKLKNVKMYKEQQEIFKTRFFSLLFSPKNTNYRNRGIRSINAVLEEDNMPYRIISGKETKSSQRNSRWWMVIETGEDYS